MGMDDDEKYIYLFEDNGKTFKGEPGNTFIIPADTTHRDTFNYSKGLKVLLIHFSWGALPEYFTKVNNSNINKIPKESAFEISCLFDAIRMDSGHGTEDHILANARLINLLMLFHRETAILQKKKIKNDTSSNQKRLLVAAKNYIEKNYTKPIRLEEVAAALEVSPFYLSRIFSRESDFSLFRYLTEIRIHEAKKLLWEGRHIVGDIAIMVGFESSNYFSKVFKKYVGCSPTNYKADDHG